MKRADTVRQTADLFFAAEESVFTALRDVAALTVGLIDGRRALSLSPVVGAAIMGRVGAVHTALHATCADMIASHGELADLKVGIGAGQVELNGGINKDEKFAPPWPPAEARDAAPLRAVA